MLTGCITGSGVVDSDFETLAAVVLKGLIKQFKFLKTVLLGDFENNVIRLRPAFPSV